jgi:hypothetical protein
MSRVLNIIWNLSERPHSLVPCEVVPLFIEVLLSYHWPQTDPLPVFRTLLRFSQDLNSHFYLRSTRIVRFLCEISTNEPACMRVHRHLTGPFIQIISQLSRSPLLFPPIQFLPTLPFLIENFVDDEYFRDSESALEFVTRSYLEMSHYQYHLHSSAEDIKVQDGLIKYLEWSLSPSLPFNNPHKIRSLKIISHLISIEDSLRVLFENLFGERILSEEVV